MKRTAAAFLMVAGLGISAGCVTPTGFNKVKKETKPEGTVMTTPAQSQDLQARARATATIRAAAPSGIQQASHNDYPPEIYGPTNSRAGMMLGHGGITPTPGQGAPGAVAGVGFAGPDSYAGMYPNQRTSVRFASPAGMKIAFEDPNRGFIDAGREAPVRYNFPQGQLYRIRLSGIQNRPGKSYYPTLELYPATIKTVTFLSHSTVPVGFTDEDFDQVNAGNLVVKVIYLPDPQFQDLAAAEEIVSTRLEAGVDPIAEANRRGSILAVIRIGNIDLEDPNTPAMTAPAGYGMPARPLPPPQQAPGAPGPMPGTGAMGTSRASMTPNMMPPMNMPPMQR